MLESKLTIVLAILASCLVSFSMAQYSQCSWMESNIDYKGNDISYTYNAKTPQECSSLCASLRICTGFTFWYMTTTYQVCFLKNFTTTPTRYPSINRVSCIMVPIVTTTVKPITSTTATTLKPATSTLVPVTSTTSRPVTVTGTTTLGPVTTTTSRPVTATASTTTLAPVTTTTSRAVTTASTSTLAPVTTTTTTPALQKCFSEQDAFYGDQSAQSDMFSANSVGECCDYCVNYGTPCLAYSYLDDQKLCYVYYGVLPAKQIRANTVSGGQNPNYSTTTTTTAVSTTASTKCAYEPGSFFGFSDESDIYSASSESDCCNICAANSQRCVLFSYLADQQVCYTYFGTIQDKVDRANTISGVLLG